MDIEDIKKRAKEGDAAAQAGLAHAYLSGDGVAKNRRHYMTWLVRAAENGHLPSQMELIGILGDKRSKYSDPSSALQWMKIAQGSGATFSEEELMKVGDPDVCSRFITQYLFEEQKHDFAKAKDLLLRSHPDRDVIMRWATEYHARYASDKKKQSNIAYLYLQACEADASAINNMAVQLLAEDEKTNIGIAFILFREAHRLKCCYATASYFYCLAYGKGVRMDLNMAVDVYFQGKEQEVDFTRRFASQVNSGMPLTLPSSAEWKKLCAKHKTSKAVSKSSKAVFSGVSKAGLGFSSFFGFLTRIPSAYWDMQATKATWEELDAIGRVLPDGTFNDGDGCRDEGCTQNLICIGYFISMLVFGVATLVAIVYGATIGHIPNWLTYTILVSLFMPSANLSYGLEKMVTKSIVLLSLVGIVALAGYHIAMVADWADVWLEITSASLWEGIKLIFAIAIGVLVLFYCVTMTAFLPMGIWWHYLLGIEYTKGTRAAIIYVLLSLSIIMVAGYLLYHNGIIF